MRRMFALAMFALFTFVPVARAAAPQPEWWRNGGPRLRPQDDRITALLDQGQMRSPTMRKLVARIEAGDVFVYIAGSHRLNKHLAGSLQWMTTAGPYRYVRVTIDPTLPADLDDRHARARAAARLRGHRRPHGGRRTYAREPLQADWQSVAPRPDVGMGDRGRAGRRPAGASGTDRHAHHDSREPGTSADIVTLKSVPVMLCQASRPLPDPLLGMPGQQHVRGVLRLCSAAVQPDAGPAIPLSERIARRRAATGLAGYPSQGGLHRPHR